MPMRTATITAIVTLRMRAAMTAANAADTSNVTVAGSRVTTGAARMPARPARNVATTQTPAATGEGFVPESDVIARESTIARTVSPASVKRRTNAPATTIATTHA